MFRPALWLSTTALVLPAAAFAQSTNVQGAATTTDSYHSEAPPEIIITAPYQRNQADILSGTSVLSGEELTRELRPTIGETLARQPGVSATSFGPNASRPVLRGLQGERVRVLTDGIGSFDVSNTSVDHAVAINPLTADRIEVLRGPSALLFGSSAIGGVVNVIDSRIPRRVPDEPIHADAIATYGSAANERSGSASVDVPVTDKVVFHLDGTYGKTDDLDTGGYILSRPLRRQAAASTDADIRELADLKGKLPNSQSKMWEVAGGAAIVTDTGNLGFSVSHLDNRYGVPIRYSLDGGEAEEVTLHVQQTRADMRGEVDTGGGLLEKIRLRAGFADYRHDEIEDTGEIGTSFFNQSVEARLELVQAARGGWRGAVGGQMFIRDFNVQGDEKFVPRNETQQFGLFTLQSFDMGAFRAEAGGRYEYTVARASADALLGNGNIRRGFDSFSGSLGGSVGLAENIRFGVNASHTERAPSAEELFANGPHAGTQAFEVGNPAFAKEISDGLEATLKGSGDGYSFGLSAYHNWFRNFIYENPTGAVEDDLPVFQYAQADARLWGFEAEASARLAKFGETAINLDGLADYTRATIVDRGPAPRIPPLRVLGGIEAQGRMVQVRGEVEHVTRQDRVSNLETTTPAYTMVNASVSLRPFGRDSNTTLMLSANNIFDVEARRHASFLKDYAPLAGRDIRVTARLAL
ncbi:MULTISPECIES: TonB-dependent receptor [unclassified Sphingomonas]|uniref:TonB-dependent receptor n=1 Tax=unclassified Sphingomonas TaxID=196159 RepID=UPI0006FF1030|nr:MULTISPECIES: TonB-dependent receptor [unclassified Sphingomonas]KQM61828.1 TonB-dependent receptor [Sphingomonas sp. Leaf16]KQN13101.1 TonB-dependent receptor [Sphingomonas sp. Leaf29]KQN19988.1 TonB-dependent receptor [Sphingomonas sp. Leaf32]